MMKLTFDRAFWITFFIVLSFAFANLIIFIRGLPV